MIHVTITGADDMVNPVDLYALSRRFPFVEWGVLMSGSRKGTPRYPTDSWLTALCNGRPNGVYVSAHLCGEMFRAAMRGEWVWPATVNRVQLNGFVEVTYEFKRLADYHGTRYEFILQCRDAAYLPSYANMTKMLPSASVLFDPSGGRGIEQVTWPRVPAFARVAFAGGINEDNVEATIEACSKVTGHSDFYVDLETGARTKERFDLEKVERILTKVATVNATTDARTAGGGR